MWAYSRKKGGTMKLLHKGSIAIGLLACFASVTNADPASTSDLLQLMPAATNAVVVVQVQRILSSAYARKAGWDKITKTVYLAGTVPINPSAERIVIGSEFDPQHLGESWYVGLISMKKPISLSQIAARHNGKIEEVADQQVAVMHPYGYVTALKNDVLAAVNMPEHQAFARWLRFANDPNRASTVNAYLAATPNDNPNNHI